ncbi:MAG: ATP-binding protein [Chloroflexota bacterium]
MRVVRERIDPRLTASLFVNYRSATDALLELVDNAVDSRRPGTPLRVDVTIRPGTVLLTAIGGTGMGPAQLERDYLRWGASPKRSGDRIGRFGQGGKAAIGHLGNRFSILASPAGHPRAYRFEDDDYRNRSRLRTYELTERPKPVDDDLGYVKIEIGAVDRRLDPRRLPNRLGEVYRPLLESGDLVLTVNHGAVPPPALPTAERQPFTVRAGGRLVRGWYGTLPDPPPPDIAAGMRIYHLGRLVGEPVWFGHSGPALHPGLNRLVGEVELPHVAVTMNKSDVDVDDPHWLAVEARLHALLAPLVRRLTREGVSAATPQALRTAEQVRRIIARALRLLDAGRLFESAVALDGGPGGPGGQLTLGGGASGPEEPVADEEDAAGDGKESGSAEDAGLAGEADSPPEPPRPRSATSGDGTRRGIGEIVIRDLDPRLRSAMVVEDGVRRVVINSRYPLYQVRKGDLWYQLETALREVCVTIPEATVPEFERKVNELMLLSLNLAGRRRKRRTAAPPPVAPWARDAVGRRA